MTPRPRVCINSATVDPERTDLLRDRRTTASISKFRQECELLHSHVTEGDPDLVRTMPHAFAGALTSRNKLHRGARFRDPMRTRRRPFQALGGPDFLTPRRRRSSKQIYARPL